MNEDIKNENLMKRASEAARALGKLGASKGGKARAEKLSPEERRKIAVDAAASRWGTRDEPRAICGSPDRPLKIGPVEIEAYVLEDGTRVLSQRQFLEALGRHPKANVRNEGGEERLPVILQGKSIGCNSCLPRSDRGRR